MPSSYSSSLRFNLQATGENTNTWGSLLNTGALALIDSAIAGFTTIALTGNVTLTTANGSSDQARTAMIKLTGSASYQVTVPAVSKQYLIWNASSYQQTIASAGGGLRSSFRLSPRSASARTEPTSSSLAIRVTA